LGVLFVGLVGQLDCGELGWKRTIEWIREKGSIERLMVMKEEPSRDLTVIFIS